MPAPKVASTASTLLIRGGRVIDPASGHDAIADVAIKDGLIAAIGKNLSRSDVAREIDAKGSIVAPGLIDPHVHLREPGQEHKETISTGALAAVVGGFTTVCCMPNTQPAIDSPEIVEFVHARGRAANLARVFAVAAATRGRKGEELTEIELLAASGAVGISDDGDCIPTAGMMSRVLSATAATGLVFMQHCQDPTLTRGSAMHAGEISVRLGLGGWPRVAEEIIIERDVRLNRGIGCRYHVQHISSGESVEIVSRARAMNQPVTAEASPHHLLLTHEACDGYNTNAKVNPPLRERKDVEAVRQGVADGTITVLATDHAPHSIDEKSLPFEDAPFGLIGLETALPLYVEALIETKLIDWPRLIELLTIQPARLCNLDRCGLGRIAVGGPADITVIDPDAAWTIGTEHLRSKSRNTPFLGRRVKSRAACVVVGGRIVHEL
jgi:dihydroorotase